MSVAGGDEQVAILAWQGPQRRGVWIEQRPQDRREGGLRRSAAVNPNDFLEEIASGMSPICPGMSFSKRSSRPLSWRDEAGELLTDERPNASMR
jgi:hypothetical protein